MNPNNYVLYSGGAQGSETSFGKIAEKFGVQEVNFTFDGHKIFRTRGVRVLTTEELLKGDVSLLLDEEEVRLEPFDTVVQRGTNHAWVNHGEEPALLIAVLIDSELKE